MFETLAAGTREVPAAPSELARLDNLFAVAQRENWLLYELFLAADTSRPPARRVRS